MTARTDSVLPPYRHEPDGDARHRVHDDADDLFGRSTAVFAMLSGPRHILRSANPTFFEVLGADPADVGRPLAEVAPGPARQGLLECLDDVYAAGRPHSSQDIPVLLRGGHGNEAYLDLVAEPRHDAGGRVIGVRLLGVDTTPLKHAQALAAEQRALLEQIARDAPVEEVLTGMTRIIEDLSPGVLASVLLLDPDGVHLRHGAAPSLPDFYNQAVDGIVIGEGVAGCGTAAHDRRTVVAADIATDPAWADHRDVAAKAGLAASWSTPIVSAGGRLLGTFTMYHRTPRTPQAFDLALCAAFARTAALAVERHRAEEARALAEAKEKAAREDLAFLLEAGTALAQDLDYEQTFRRLARLCVPELAPLCVVDAVSEGRLRRVAVAARDPRDEELLASHIPPYPVDGPVSGVLATGTTRTDQCPPGALGPWPSLDVTGYVCIPLRERGRTYGTLTLLTTGTHGIDERQVALAEELARRASPVARNARQYHDRARIARDLQEGLLLADMPDLPGCDLAAWYRPAGEGLDIGGDFYDIFPLPGGRWAFMIGDVCGRGPLAATTTALVRHTARAVAPLLMDPVAVAGAVNSALIDHASGHGGDFVTLVYGHLRPHGDGLAVELVRAGHLMPVHHRPRSAAAPVRSDGILLGAFPDAALEAARLTVRPGESLLLATDGITESRDRYGEQFGEEGMMRALDTAGPAARGAQGVLDAVIHAVSRHCAGAPTDDDQAVLVLTAV